MSFLLNEPAAFVDDMTRGFVLAHSDVVKRVPGGVVRAAAPVRGQVAIVIGGGSGHYPAFAGLVGPGLAHGAAMGNVFASPSAQQVYDVARAVESGGGVLLTYGNYAGDVLNFDQAQDRLRAAGVPCETVLVTDDMSSAPVGEESSRRGIAGDLIVFKVAAAAAEQGASLAEVARIARRANTRTRTLGVAFSGCTLPGADAPLFTVPAGRMGVGMGIHGEQGIHEADRPGARDLAALLVDSVLAEPADAADAADSAVDGTRRAVVLVNGLGSVKGEELYLLFGNIAEHLAARHVQIVQPEVGELVTSFEMAGVSLTVCWVDDALEQLWSAPARTAAYHKGAIDTPAVSISVTDVAAGSSPLQTERTGEVEVGSADSQAAAAVIARALAAARDALDAHADELGRLDAVAGDGDHGIGMLRGMTAAVDEATAAHRNHSGAGTVLSRAGAAWADRAGGTSGALWGVMLQAAGTVLGDHDAVAPDRVAAAVAAACDRLVAAGKAEIGDKTMVDALVPFSAGLTEHIGNGVELCAAWRHAVEAAERAAQRTADLLPRRGRARPHAEASRGTADPGAVSLAIVVAAVGSVLDADGRDTGGGR